MSSPTQQSRRCIPISNRFCCFGKYYVIASTSLAGSKLEPDQLAKILSLANPEDIRILLGKGICIPLVFQEGDYVMDNAIVILGDLTEEEEAEWIGRICGYLKIDCGKLLFVAGGGEPDDWKDALLGKFPDGEVYCFDVIDVSPGDYLVEIYAYVSSLTVADHFTVAYNYSEDRREMEKWFRNTRPDQPLPKWIEAYGNWNSLTIQEELVDYIIRLSLLTSTPTFPQIPKLVPSINWCGKFDFRHPKLCPLGISRSKVLGK
ncbi:MAG: hypothetical protein HY819_07385 [Acidobacteria bacterium]|nr:hypothetical protein [Acidobacteriota bacterium]